MQVTFGPKVARRVLRYQLTRFREMAGKSQKDAAERIGLKQPAVNHFEKGTNLPSQSNLEVLLTFYNQDDQFPMLAELLTVARLRQGQQGTIHQDAEQTSSMNDFELAIGLEAFATGIEAFEPLIVTGLLQTEAYGRALISYHAEITPGVDVEQSLSLRLRRQDVIMRDHPAELWCVVEEQALRRPIGGGAVMAEQLDHLLTVTERPNVTVQVIPQAVGLHPALQGAFYMLRFEDDWRVAYEETRRSAYYYDAPEAIEDYERVMNHLRHLTLNPKRSRALISQIRKEVTST